MKLIGIEEHFLTAEVREAWTAIGLEASNPGVAFHSGTIESISKTATGHCGLVALPDLVCPDLIAKIFLFSSDPNHRHIRRRLVPLEGRIAIVTDAGGMQWTRQRRAREMMAGPVLMNL